MFLEDIDFVVSVNDIELVRRAKVSSLVFARNTIMMIIYYVTALLGNEVEKVRDVTLKPVVMIEEPEAHFRGSKVVKKER